MNETLRELASRYLDGDLSDAEALELERRAEHDSDLAAEIDGTRRLGLAVAALADGMEPPAALDRVVEPLRQSAPAPFQRVRPLYRWLGAAAAMVLGVTVAVEVARRNPEPSLSRPSPAGDLAATQRREIFELAPLPTARPDDDRPLGAEDRLLDEQPSEPRAPEPLPLEVMGPLSTDAPAVVSDARTASSARRQSVAEDEGAESKMVEKPASTAALGMAASAEIAEASLTPAPPGKGPSSADEDRQDAARPSRALTTAGGESGRRRPERLPTVVHIGGVEIWSGVSVDCTPGSWRGQIEVQESKVVALEPLPGAADAALDGFRGSCHQENLISSILTGVADGIHIAEIVIDHRSE